MAGHEGQLARADPDTIAVAGAGVREFFDIWPPRQPIGRKAFPGILKNKFNACVIFLEDTRRLFFPWYPLKNNT